MNKTLIDSNEIISKIYKQLTECYPYKVPNNIRQNIRDIIKAIILKKLFDHYNITKAFRFVLDSKSEERLIKHLTKLHKERNENVSVEVVRKEVEQLSALIGQVVDKVLAEESENA